VSEDVQTLRIRRVHWLAAVRATYFQTRQTANGGTPMLNSDGEQIDLLTQELERADNVDPVVATGSGGVGSDSGIATGGTGGISNDRTSLTQAYASDGGINGTEHEKLLAQHQTMSNFTNSAKLSNESPSTSGRNTPTSTAMQKRPISRAETSTPPPPSLTGGSSSSKHRSLT
jgi:hypothetical protein